MSKRKARKRGFTLIEVLAALGIIIVLTMTLLVTIKGQIDRANTQNLAATVETVNMQIEVAFRQAGVKAEDYASPQSLAKAGIISEEQRQQLADVTFKTGNPPSFETK